MHLFCSVPTRATPHLCGMFLFSSLCVFFHRFLLSFHMLHLCMHLCDRDSSPCVQDLTIKGLPVAKAALAKLGDVLPFPGEDSGL